MPLRRIPDLVRKNPVRLFYEEAVQRGYSASDISFEYVNFFISISIFSFRRNGTSHYCCIYLKNKLISEKSATGHSAVKRGAALIALEKMRAGWQ